ncbi:unnamed protein product [Gongylonema pulchrum]|uniref:Uncharacterized protein n=1 Tax=Gongylonema pulchrum TaxID=637853 RepID=A0A3P6TJZ0_9BILA|nr:unnamed protein product [Gongylonema pulchrum]
MPVFNPAAVPVMRPVSGAPQVKSPVVPASATNRMFEGIKRRIVDSDEENDGDHDWDDEPPMSGGVAPRPQVVDFFFFRYFLGNSRNMHVVVIAYEWK